MLALQGGVQEHLEMLAKLPEVNPVAVKKEQELREIDGLILPGGESTTIGKLLDIFALKQVIIEEAKAGLPIWGTCAGLILLAKEIEGAAESYLNLMEITVKRNAYGNQLASFKSEAVIPKLTEDKIPLVFIRAPFVTAVGNNTEVLLELKGKIVAVEEGNLLATSFHPELSTDLTMHRYFVDKVSNSLEKMNELQMRLG